MFSHASYTCLNYFLWFSAAYVCLKLLNFFWIAVRDYVLPVFKKPVDFKKYGQWAGKYLFVSLEFNLQ